MANNRYCSSPHFFRNQTALNETHALTQRVNKMTRGPGYKASGPWSREEAAVILEISEKTVTRRYGRAVHMISTAIVGQSRIDGHLSDEIRNSTPAGPMSA